jgi:cell division septation protein DedD
VIETDVERYVDAQSFAREVNLPLLGEASIASVPAGAGVSTLLAVQPTAEIAAIVDGLHETRRSLSLRSLLLAGFPADRECFAVGLAIAREWSRRELKVAVVDLDFWHPTVVRPLPHPNEGLVDVLEYGCSFRRVAWEIVANALWVVGPGSHPPEPDRLVHHPDWERAARGFAAQVDVTLYVAPLFHRDGFVGRLSKRMDGVVLAASVERVGRTELRDAFLELWGSDAPIIGCAGIHPAGATPYPVPEPDVEAEAPAAEPFVPVAGAYAPADSYETEAASVEIPERSAGDASEVMTATRQHEITGAEPAEIDLTALLDREVRFGDVRVKRIRRSRLPLIVGAAVGLGIAASLVLIVTRHPVLPSMEETMPAGTERVLPAPPDRPLSAGLGGTPAPLPSLDQGGLATPGGTQNATPAAPSAASTSEAQTPAAASGKPAPLAASAPPQPAATKSAPPVATKSAPPVATKSAPPVATKSAPAPNAASAPPLPGKDSNPFRVHVASFKSEEKVMAIVRGLKAHGEDAWYERSPVPNGYYRVFVGHFATESEARAHARRLLENGWVDRAQSYPPTGR